MIVMVFVLCTVSVLLFTPFFNVQAIEVKGTTHYDQEKIIQTSGLVLGQNGFHYLGFSPEALLGLRFTHVEEKLKTLPYIKTAKAQFVMPDSVRINLTERAPAAYMVYLDNFLLVDEEGYVLEAASKKPAYELKEIRGIDFSMYALGQKLDAGEVEEIKLAVAVFNAIDLADNDSELLLWDVVDWIDMVDRYNAILSLDERIVVRFNPNNNLQYTINFAKEVYFKKINANERGRLEFMQNQKPSFIPE